MEVEQLLNLVHRTESMQRAKDAFTKLPPNASDKFQYDSEFESEGEDVGPSQQRDLPEWLLSNSYITRDANIELVV